jgi:hypothetical protein
VGEGSRFPPRPAGAIVATSRNKHGCMLHAAYWPSRRPSDFSFRKSAGYGRRFSACIGIYWLLARSAQAGASQPHNNPPAGGGPLVAVLEKSIFLLSVRLLPPTPGLLCARLARALPTSCGRDVGRPPVPTASPCL